MAQKGKIFVRVTLSKAQIPIIGAHVNYVKSNGVKNILLNTQLTDENGKTSEIEFDTPNEENSQNDINPDNRFFTCDIIVTHPSYYTTYIKNVQIFANQTTVQEVNVLPIEEDSDPAGIYETIDITSQDL